MRLYDLELVLSAVALRSWKCYLGWKWVCNSMGVSLSRPCFLISDETSASLNLNGKVPSEKERLARVKMSSEKTEKQDF